MLSLIGAFMYFIGALFAIVGYVGFWGSMLGFIMTLVGFDLGVGAFEALMMVGMFIVVIFISTIVTAFGGALAD